MRPRPRRSSVSTRSSPSSRVRRRPVWTLPLTAAQPVSEKCDRVTDGEQSRPQFVHGFLEATEGGKCTRRVTIGSRADRYKAEVPTVTGPLARRRAVHADEVAFARAHTAKPLKFTIPGPMTIVDTLADEHYRDRRRLAMEFARVINEEARELVARGLDVLQLDEPAFNVYMDDVQASGTEALHRP